MMKKIAAITMAYNDEFFLNRWIAYYGRELGERNLYIYLDGVDQKIPSGAGSANITRIPKPALGRTKGDKYRIGLMNKLAAELFAQGYDLVIGCDCDEFLIVDPNTNKSLAQYLSDLNIKNTVSGLGLDVGQDMNLEYELDTSKPFLAQRSYALLSTRYTKPVVIAKNQKSEIRNQKFPRWGSGFHSVKRTNFHIDKNLYLLHFGFADYNTLLAKAAGRDPTWQKHLKRQIARTILMITNKKRRRESYIKLARTLQTIFRPIYTWTKPAMFGLKLVTKIPERFRKSNV